MADKEKLKDGVMYEAQAIIHTPYGVLEIGKEYDGELLKDVLVYELSPNQPMESFFKEVKV
jgi:hypothetical protein